MTCPRSRSWLEHKAGIHLAWVKSPGPQTSATWGLRWGPRSTRRRREVELQSCEGVLGWGEMGGSGTAPLSLRLKTRSQGWRERTQLGGETRGLQARVQDQTCQLRGKEYSQSGPPPLLTATCGLGPQPLTQTLGSDVSRDGEVFGGCCMCCVSRVRSPTTRVCLCSKTQR